MTKTEAVKALDEILIGKVKQSIGQVKTDCFGYDKANKKCAALKELYCKTEKCNFFKTKEQFEAVKDYSKILRKTKLTDKDKAKKLELEQY